MIIIQFLFFRNPLGTVFWSQEPKQGEFYSSWKEGKLWNVFLNQNPSTEKTFAKKGSFITNLKNIYIHNSLYDIILKAFSYELDVKKNDSENLQ